MADADFDELLDAMKKAAGALRDAGVPYVLAGGLAAWARGGPATEHDVDFMVTPDDAERALEALEACGLRTERPPEGWLFKAFDGEAMIDIIFEPTGIAVGDDLFERSEELNVHAVPMLVATANDIMASKLAALTEHELDYDSCLELGRSLREQIDWPLLREQCGTSPYAKAFFTLADELGIAA